MKQAVIVNEVGARDGLQNQAKVLSTSQRVQLIHALADAGLRHIEVGSFVSPKAVPCMAGTDAVLAALPASDGMRYSVLVPNIKGYELALAAGARNLVLMLSATDTFSVRNIGMSNDAALAIACRIVSLCRSPACMHKRVFPWRSNVPMKARSHPEWWKHSRKNYSPPAHRKS